MTAVRNLLVLACTAVLAFSQEILTNEDVIKLTNAGLSEEVVLGTIQSKVTKFSLGTDDLIALKKAGVSDKVIAAMVARNQNQPANQNTPAALVFSAPLQAASSTVEPLLLHDGTPIRLRLSRNLSSADAKTGETVDFEVLEDVKVEDVLIIARGATALGTITDAEHKKTMGRGGKLNVEIDHVRLADDENAALRAIKETSGGGHIGAMTGGMVATAIVFFPAAPFFLFMHGKDTTIPKGTEITAYINGEIKLDRQKFSVRTVAARVDNIASVAPSPIAAVAASTAPANIPPSAVPTAPASAPAATQSGQPLHVVVAGDSSQNDQLYYQIDNGDLHAWSITSAALALDAQNAVALYVDNGVATQHLSILVNGKVVRLSWVPNGSDKRGLKTIIRR